MRKKTLIISLSALILLAVIGAGALVLIPSLLNDRDASLNVDNINVTLNSEDDLQGGTSSNTTTSLGDDTSSQDDGQSNTSQNENGREPTNMSDIDDDSDDKNTEPSQDGDWNPNWSADRMLNEINIENTEQVASDFIEAYLNYDSESLADGSWRRSVTNFVDMSEIDDETANSSFLARVTDKRWAVNTGTYDGVYSKVESVDDVSVYASNISSGANTVNASVKVTFVASGLPANTSFYKQRNRYQATFIVQFDDSGRAVKNCIQSSTKTIDSNLNGVEDESGAVL